MARTAAAAASLPLVVLEMDPNAPRGAFTMPSPPAQASSSSTTPNSLDDIVLLLQTSGTTGRPKRVLHTLRGLLSTGAAMAESLQLSAKNNDVGLNMMPMHHIGGIACNLFAPLLSGSVTLFAEGFDPQRWHDVVYKRRPLWPGEAAPPEVTWSYAVPAMWLAILRVAESNQQQQHSLRLVRNGAADLPHSVALRLQAMLGENVAVLPTYGMSECIPITSPPISYRLREARQCWYGLRYSQAECDQAERWW